MSLRSESSNPRVNPLAFQAAIRARQDNTSRAASIATFSDYLAIARFDHMTKHVFMIPGIILAYVLRGIYSHDVIASLAFGVISATCIAAANYVINEWL